MSFLLPLGLFQVPAVSFRGSIFFNQFPEWSWITVQGPKATTISISISNYLKTFFQKKNKRFLWRLTTFSYSAKGPWNISLKFFFLLSMEEIPNNHLGCIQPYINNGINYQPQLVSPMSSIKSIKYGIPQKFQPVTHWLSDQFCKESKGPKVSADVAWSTSSKGAAASKITFSVTGQIENVGSNDGRFSP